MRTKVFLLKNRPVGMPVLADFALVEEEVPVVQEGEVLLKTLYVSVDPYLRGRMSGTKIPRFELGAPLASKMIAQVIESKHPGYQQGDYVAHYLNWKEYQVSNGTGLVQVDGALSVYLGVLGVTGLSAYFALQDIGKPTAGETLVVSGAAGAVGSIAGQIGKIKGCRVVGIVGADEKVELITKQFGFDDAINYKTTPDIKAAITHACPNGVDIYFDNVGGTISDAVIAHMNPYGRIPVCGTIANYNDTSIPMSPSILPQVVYKFLTIQGFLIADFAKRFPEGMTQLSNWISEKKLTYVETIREGFEQLPQAFLDLFEGKNEGKMIVKV